MELLKTLNIDLTLLPINIVGFLLLLFVANKLVFKPIGKVIDERQEDIASTYSSIDAQKAEMERLRSDYTQRLAAIEEERRETVQKAISEALSTRDQIIQEATARSHDMVTKAEQEVAREHAQAMISLRQNVVDLAMNAAHKVIGDSLDETRQRKLISDFINSGTPVVSSAAANGAASVASSIAEA